MKRNTRNNSQIISNKFNKRYRSANRLLTSTVGTIISLILLSCFIGATPTSATSSTLSLSIDNSTVSMSVSPTNVNGSFNKSSASTISASTNNATGYTLSIAAPSSSGTDYDKLINGSDNTAKLNSISEATTKAQFKDISGTSYNGKWGYLPSKYHSQDNSDFLPAPTTTGDILDQTSVANTASSNTTDLTNTANTYSLAIGVRVDSSVKTGAYTNNFVVKLVANAIPYTITYVDDITSNMPIDIDTTSPDTTITISSNTPTRNGYTFNGWCTVLSTTNANGTDTCSGTTVQPGGTLTISQTDTSQNNFILHAMWTGNYSINNLTYLQDFTYMDADKKGKIVMSMIPETNYTLKDSRDNQDYTIAKLKDGNVWMTKNLNLAGGTTISCTTTDCDEGYALPSDQGWQSTPGKLPASSTTGFNQNNYAYVYNSNSTTCGEDAPCYSYYSWDAAMLGSGRNLNTENIDAPYSICPKGWRLPTTGSNTNNGWKRGDFYRLATAYGANLENSYREEPSNFYNNAGSNTAANFVLTGYYSNSSFYDKTYGLYSSSTSCNSSDIRRLNFTATYVNSDLESARHFGIAVRCLLR